jgi:hypothetical protein
VPHPPPNLSRSDTPGRAWLAVILLLYLFLSVLFPDEAMESDHLAYLQESKAVLDGAQSGEQDHRGLRYGFLAPTALAFRLFGFGYVPSVLFPHLCGILLLWTAYRYGRETDGPATGLLAALFVCVTPVFLHWSTTCMPDIPMTLCLSYALLTYLRATRTPPRATSLYARCGLVLFLGYLVKSTLLEASLILFLEFLYRRHRQKRWDFRKLIPFGVLLCGIALETAAYGLATGDPMRRIKADLGALHSGHYWLEQWGSSLAGLWIYPKSLLSPLGGFGWMFLLAAAGMIYSWRAGKNRFSCAWALGLIALAVFHAYRHGHPSSRVLAPIVVPVATLAASPLAGFLTGRHRTLLYPAAAGIALANLFSHYCSQRTILESRDPIPPLARFLLDRRDGSPVYTDVRTARLLCLYLAMEAPDEDRRIHHIKIREFESGPPSPLALVVWYPLKLEFLRTFYGIAPPHPVDAPPPRWREIQTFRRDTGYRLPLLATTREWALAWKASLQNRPAPHPGDGDHLTLYEVPPEDAGPEVLPNKKASEP